MLRILTKFSEDPKDNSNFKKLKMAELSQPISSAVAASLSWTRGRQIALSIADQGFSVGGMFLASIMLARTQTKSEYGIFALTYSIFTFITGLYNAAILEAYTIYGSGRYHQRFSAYSRLLWRRGLFTTFGASLILTIVWVLMRWLSPRLASPTILGMALACGVSLTALFLRRTFYMRGRPDLAARISGIFFFSCGILLWFAVRSQVFNGFYAFTIGAAGWFFASLFIVRDLPGRGVGDDFTKFEPDYWREHWKYSRWVLVTALVFQLTTQAYYWLSAAVLSVKETGELRAIYNLIAPVDQVSAAIVLLILPMLSFRFSTRRIEGLLPLWKVYCAGWLLATAFFAGIINLFAKPMMHALYAGKFDDIAYLLGILSLLPFVMGVGNTINAALKAMECPQAVFYAYVASGLATVAGGLPLLIRFRFSGAIYGMLLSGTAYTFALGLAFVYSLNKERRSVQSVIGATSPS
jgi:O-antigen/teichoic acid export membrane protein